jgi:hypothetical protein
MTRVVDGVPVTVSTIEEPVMTRHGWRTQYRGTFESNVPSRWSDAAVLRYAPQHFGVGQMHEVPLERSFPFRVFAIDPAHAGVWLGPSMRSALIQLGVVHSLVIRAGRVCLTTAWPVVSPEYAGPLTSIVADIHNGRAPIHPPARNPAPSTVIAAEIWRSPRRG